jgi:hypothetical protein
MRTKVSNLKGKGKGKSRDQDQGRYRDLPREEERIGDDPDETRRWEEEEQQVSFHTTHAILAEHS